MNTPNDIVRAVRRRVLTTRGDDGAQVVETVDFIIDVDLSKLLGMLAARAWRSKGKCARLASGAVRIKAQRARGET